jgi:hypothetical protein
LLLWLSWRAIRFDPLTRATPATLVGTVRRAEPPRFKRWHFLALLFGLLVLRSVFYSLIGTAVNWTPRLNLSLVSLAFHRNGFAQVLLFSFLSFTRTWLVFHFWLIALGLINERSAGSDPIHKMIVLQLGGVARWPRTLQWILPLLVTGALWLLAHPLLVSTEVVNHTQSVAHLLGQCALMGLSLYLTLKHLLPVILFLHLIATYVYLGNSPIWDFISRTARQILRPLGKLRRNRIDFAPLVGIVLILLLFHAVPFFVLYLLDQNHLALWPQ